MRLSLKGIIIWRDIKLTHQCFFRLNSLKTETFDVIEVEGGGNK
jgi:hypothetical protein